MTDERSSGSGFLSSIEFLTGEDPNAASFLLVVGMITVVFISGFQLLLPEPVSHLLTALVVVVAVFSLILGAILDTLGHFDSQ